MKAVWIYESVLGSKGILPLMPMDFFALCAPEIPKTFEIRPNRAAAEEKYIAEATRRRRDSFLCFYGSQSHLVSRWHALFDLLTLAS